MLNSFHKIMLIGMLETYLKNNDCKAVIFAIKENGDLLTINLNEIPTTTCNNN